MDPITSTAVPVDVLPRLERKVRDAGRKCQRWGLASPVLTTSDPYEVADPASLMPREIAPRIAVVDLTLVAPERIGIPGWTLLARIDVLPDGSWLTLRTPGTETRVADLPTITDPQACDHCHSRRHRKDTFLVVDASGDITQVGRNCLKDHLGYSPERLLLWSNLTRDMDDIMGEPSGGERLMPTTHLMRTAARVAAHGGYMGKAKAEELALDRDRHVSTTREWAEAIWQAQEGTAKGNHKDVMWLADLDARFPDDASTELLYVATLSAINEGDGSGEWFDNVTAIVAQTAVRPRHWGIAISAVVLGLKRLQPERPERDLIISLPLGSVGERLAFEGIVTYTRQFENPAYDSTTTLIKFRVGDADVTWWASKWMEVAVGDTITGKGTVKAQDLDKYTRRMATTVTNVRGAVITTPEA
jgi:hypothetical protein